MMNVFTLQTPTYSQQVGLQNKFCFHVHCLTSGLFYENSTELDEVVLNVYCRSQVFFNEVHSFESSRKAVSSIASLTFFAKTCLLVDSTSLRSVDNPNLTILLATSDHQFLSPDSCKIFRLQNMRWSFCPAVVPCEDT